MERIVSSRNDARQSATRTDPSNSITQFNLVVAVLSMFLLLTKVTLHTLHIFWPFLSLLVHGLLIGLFGYSLYGQTASDLSDPRYPQHGAPWYITKSCSVSSNYDIKGYCQQAKGSLAITACML